MFAHFGSLLLELIKFGWLRDEEIAARVDIEGEEHVRQAYRQGRGVLHFTGHFGYWEMMAIGFSLRVEPVSVLARPLDNPHLHAMLERTRTRSGNNRGWNAAAVAAAAVAGQRHHAADDRADRREACAAQKSAPAGIEAAADFRLRT